MEPQAKEGYDGMRRGVVEMNKWKRIFFILLLIPKLVFAQEAAESELHTYGDQEIEYINFTGTHQVIDSAQAIVETGRNLERLRVENGAEGVLPGRYSLRRISPPREGRTFGADIFSILPGAGVDHVVNLRRILSGYLMESFGYSETEAWDLAVLITLYNTYLRGRSEYFTTRYAPEVLTDLEMANLGLARNYNEWPGKTAILIPLLGSGRVGTGSENWNGRNTNPDDDSSQRGTDTTEEGDPLSTAEGRDPSLRGEEGDPRLAVDEVSQPEEALDRESTVSRVEPKAWWHIEWLGFPLYIFLIIIALLLMLLLLWLLSRKRSKAKREIQKHSLLPAGSSWKTLLGEHGTSSLKRPVFMRLVYHDLLLKLKILGDLPLGEVKYVGGRGSYFHIPYLEIPQKIAQVENTDEGFVFTPLDKDFFPELSEPIKGFLRKEILVQAKEGDRIVLSFHKYVSPLEEINRILRYGRNPGHEHEED